MSGHVVLGRALAAAAVLVLAACSDDDAVGPTTTIAATSVPAAECLPADPDLLVDQIADAVAAVEAQLGGPQRFFEVNATAVEVTVIVADVDAGTATPFRFRDGTLLQGDPLEGSGLTFAADQLVFDPRRVIACVDQQLPTSTLGMFYVIATEAGGVRRAVLVTSSAGGQLEVEVGDDGTIAGVDPLGEDDAASVDPAATGD
jgi:hypothetical protein